MDCIVLSGRKELDVTERLSLWLSWILSPGNSGPCLHWSPESAQKLTKGGGLPLTAAASVHPWPHSPLPYLPFPMHEVDVVLGGRGAGVGATVPPRSSAGWGQMGASWGLPLPLGGTPRSKPGPRAQLRSNSSLTGHLLQPGSGLEHRSASSEPRQNHGKGLPPAQLVDGETEALEA